jgi:hypothetical protein
MPSSLDTPSTPAARALDWLRGRANPFDNLVRSQRPDDRFADLHVPALLREERELILAVIDAYRLTEYRSAADLRETRVVTVLGPRGAGKTHMLEALAHRTDGKAQLLVRPAYYETDAAFEKQLLDHLVNAVLAEDPVHGGKPFLAVADQLTRRLLRQAVRSLGPTDRLFALGEPARRWRLLWRGGEATVSRFSLFADDLADRATGKDLHALAAQQGFAPELLFQLVTAHVQRHEAGADALSAIRRELFLAMARTTLLQDGEAFGRFLEADYTLPNARPFFRADVVRQQLHALVEACALVQLPVVFAFDNLEGLLAPLGNFDVAQARALMDSLAQAVDTTRGLLFVLFAEIDLYRSVRKTTHQFALDRLDQGVPLHGRGPVDVIELKPPRFEELRLLIGERVSQQLKGFPEAEALPANFPFAAAFLDKQAQQTGTGLRNVMLRLRDEYSRVVFGRSTPAIEGPAPAVDWGPMLELTWNEKLTAANRKLKEPLVSHASALHAGLRRLLQHASPAALGGFEPMDVKPQATLDDNTIYSQLTVADWRQVPAAGGSNGSTTVVRVSVGFLLGKGPGLPRDLQAKLAPLPDDTRKADCLVVLWPRNADGDLVEALPRATRDVWESGTGHFRAAALRPLTNDDLRKLLAFPDWLDGLQGLVEAPIPVEVVRTFVQQHCRAVVQLALPPAPKRTVSDAH